MTQPLQASSVFKNQKSLFGDKELQSFFPSLYTIVYQSTSQEKVGAAGNKGLWDLMGPDPEWDDWMITYPLCALFPFPV